MRIRYRYYVALALLSATVPSATASAQHPCEALNNLKLADTTITSAKVVPAGPFSMPQIPMLTPKFSLEVPSYCKVNGQIKPTSDSDIRFEVWLPASGWNGRFLQMGNAGFAGAILPLFLVHPVSEGYAVAATDDGHQGPGTNWAIGHPEKVIDFAYRAVHLTSERSKEIVRAFYGTAQKHAYFNGCSEGGREALMEAERFPGDFDGIISGDPGNAFTGLFFSGAWDARAFQSDPKSYVPLSKLRLVQDASLRACDALDGVKDGVISRPDSCHFDPEILKCSGTEAEDCLTDTQVTAIKKVYSGPFNPRTSARINFGLEPGFETNMAAFSPDPATPRAAGLDQQFFAGFVFEDAKWDSSSLNFDADVATTQKKVGFLDATSADLQRFKAGGGKLIQYHGWNDQGVPPRTSVHYYESVVAKVGGRKTADEFYRLYMVPGMFHCLGGPGPNVFGNILAAEQPSPTPANDLQNALTEWVERGSAPHQIIASKFVDDDVSKGIVMTRPICPFPKVARWSGKGNTNEAVNFTCEEPKR